MQKPIILVTGATGAQGGSVAEALLDAGTYAVRCLTRNASSPKATASQNAWAEVVQGAEELANRFEFQRLYVLGKKKRQGRKLQTKSVAAKF